MPNAANNKDCVTLLHLASRAERTVGGAGESTLGPSVRSDNDLGGPVLKGAFLCKNVNIHRDSLIGGQDPICDIQSRLQAIQEENSRHFPRYGQNVAPCHRDEVAGHPTSPEKRPLIQPERGSRHICSACHLGRDSWEAVSGTSSERNDIRHLRLLPEESLSRLTVCWVIETFMGERGRLARKSTGPLVSEQVPVLVNSA